MNQQNIVVPSRAELSGRATHFKFRIETLTQRIQSESKKLKAAQEELARAERAISLYALKEDVAKELFSKNDAQRSAITASAQARIATDKEKLGTKRKSSLRSYYTTLLHTAGVSFDDDASLDEGIVYVLTNPQYPGHVKVGMTSGSPTSRALDYSASHGFGQNWRDVHSISTRFYRQVERTFHQRFADHRVVLPSPNGSIPREVYALSLSVAKGALYSIAEEAESSGGEVMTLLAVLEGKSVRVPSDPTDEEIQREVERRLHPDIVSARRDEISEIRRDIASLTAEIDKYKLEISEVEKEFGTLDALVKAASQKETANEATKRRFKNYTIALIIITMVAYFYYLYLQFK